MTEPTPEEWLELLRKGVDGFNDFRDQHPGWRPLFPKNANLSRWKLARVNLKDAYLLGARLQDADLSDAELQGADLLEAHLENANMVRVNMEKTSLWWAKLQGADLYKADLRNTQLIYANFQNAHLVEANLQGADLRTAQLQGANLFNAQLQGASITYVDMQDADLRGTRFDRATILSADFRGSRVNGASTVLSSRLARQFCGDNKAADTDALMQWAHLYKAHGVFELAGHCYYRARQHHRRERSEGLKVFTPSWLWGKFVNILETIFLDWSCAYGERPGGVLLWALIVILFSAQIYTLYHLNLLDGQMRPMPASMVSTIYFSTVTFTTLGLGDYRPQQVPYPSQGWWLPLYVAGEALAGALLMSLFLVTFARRMIRD